jgi:hypothetical protein
MKVMEFAKGRGSALAITLAPENADAFAREFRQVKQALFDWKAKHGSHCDMVMFSIVSKAEDGTAIESMLDRVYREEPELSPLLQSVNVEVALLDSRAQPIKRYSFGKKTSVSKPWWKFW